MPDQEGLEDAWITLGRDGQMPPAARVLASQLEAGELAFGTGGKILFRLTREGRIQVHPDVPLDTIAEEFLTALCLKKQGMDQRLAHLARLEQLALRLGQAIERRDAPDISIPDYNRAVEDAQLAENAIYSLSRTLARSHKP